MTHLLNDLLARLPQGRPYVFLDAVLDYQLDRTSHAVANFTGSDPRLVQLASGQRVLPMGAVVEAALQGLLLGRALALDRRHAFVVKHLRAKCRGVPRAGERIDLFGHSVRMSPEWGICDSRVVGAERTLLELRVTWIMFDLENTEVFPSELILPPVDEDPWAPRHVTHDFHDIRRRLGLSAERDLSLDMVRGWQRGSSLLAGKRISAGIGALAGHFPERAIYPGTLQIEAAWQGVCLLLELPLHYPSADAGLKVDLRLSAPVVPGDTMTYDVQLPTSDQAQVLCRNAAGAEVGQVHFRGIEGIVRAHQAPRGRAEEEGAQPAGNGHPIGYPRCDPTPAESQ